MLVPGQREGVDQPNEGANFTPSRQRAGLKTEKGTQAKSRKKEVRAFRKNGVKEDGQRGGHVSNAGKNAGKTGGA